VLYTFEKIGLTSQIREKINYFDSLHHKLAIAAPAFRRIVSRAHAASLARMHQRNAKENENEFPLAGP
jgi:hypothetical protein